MARLTTAGLVTWWRGLPPRAGRTAVLALDGRSGSGKTVLAAALAARADAAVVSLEEFYPGWDGLAAAPGLLVEHVLRPLAQGHPAAVPRWDWTAGAFGAPRLLAPVPLLLVEGVGCGDPTCAPYLSGLVWLDLPAALRRERALGRDGAVYAPHWDRWAAQEDAYLRRVHPERRADLGLEGPTDGAADLLVIADRRSARDAVTGGR